MKNLLSVLLSAILLLSLSACAGGVSDNQAQKDLESVLGDYTKLPIDMDNILENLGDDALVQPISPSNKPSGSNPGSGTSSNPGSGTSSNPEDLFTEDGVEMVIGNGIVAYRYVDEYTSTTTSGLAVQNKMTVIHFGSATKQGEGVYQLHFVGLNVISEMDCDNVEQARADYIAQLAEEGGFTDEEVASLKKLINGEQIHVTSSSGLWKLYADIQKDIKVTYDKEMETFLLEKEETYDDMYDQYSYEIVGVNGKVKQRVYYKKDEAGTKWITENYQFTHFSDGTARRHSVSYYDFTNQIWDESVTIVTSDENFLRRVWQKGYTEDGALEYESYIDDDKNCVYINYKITTDDPYDILQKFIYKGNDPSNNDNLIYLEEYWEDNGNLRSKFTKEGSIETREFYDEDGQLESSATYDTSKETDGMYQLIQRIDVRMYDIYVEDYENGVLVTTTRYTRETNTLYSITYHGDGVEITIYYDEDGNIIER